MACISLKKMSMVMVTPSALAALSKKKRKNHGAMNGAMIRKVGSSGATPSVPPIPTSWFDGNGHVSNFLGVQ